MIVLHINAVNKSFATTFSSRLFGGGDGCGGELMYTSFSFFFFFTCLYDI